MRNVDLRSKLYCAGPAGAAGVGGEHLSLPGLSDVVWPMIALLVFFAAATVWMFRRWGQSRPVAPVKTMAPDTPPLAAFAQCVPAEQLSGPSESREQVDRQLVGV